MPRKTHIAELEAHLARAASMRPRPDAAENNRLTAPFPYAGALQ